MGRLAEDIGFDTVCVPDELLWRVDAWPGPRGWWECVAIAGALADATERIEVGTWVLSANHRNPGVTVRAVETLDEISGGRFVFGLGAGSGDSEAEAYGLPLDHVVGRSRTRSRSSCRCSGPAGPTTPGRITTRRTSSRGPVDHGPGRSR